MEIEIDYDDAYEADVDVAPVSPCTVHTCLLGSMVELRL